MAYANDAIPAVNLNDAKRRVLRSYREWIRSVRLPNPQTGTDDCCAQLDGELLYLVDSANGLFVAGPGDSNDVLAQHTRRAIENENEAGI